jgi:hypothetical protein
MLSFRHLVFPGVGWIILMIAGLLRKVYGAVEQTMDVRVPDSDVCPYWQGLLGPYSQVVVLVFFVCLTGEAECSCDPACPSGPKGKHTPAQWHTGDHAQISSLLTSRKTSVVSFVAQKTSTGK